MLMVVSLLLALSVLAALWMAAAHADVLIALRRKAERESFYAAEAVLEAALADLADPGSSPVSREELLERPPSMEPKYEDGTFEEWRYRWRASLLPDSSDADGRGDTPFVLYNRAFGFSRSPYPAGGYPVLQVTAAVCRGDVRRGLVAEAAPLPLSLQVPAAWTSPGGLTLQGTFFLSGRDHGGEGMTGEGAVPSRPALLTGVEPVFLEGAAVDRSAGRAVVIDGGRGYASSPGEVLGLSGESRRLGALPAPREGAEVLSGLSFFTTDWSGPLSGEGVVVVHNPRFLPRLFEASRLALEKGVFTDDYDPEYSHLDPGNRPATLEVVRGGEFRGLVIADALGPVYDEVRVVGAVVSLGRSPSVVRAYRDAEVLYSREALREAELGPVTERLSFKALPQDSLTSDIRCD